MDQILSKLKLLDMLLNTINNIGMDPDYKEFDDDIIYEEHLDTFKLHLEELYSILNTIEIYPFLVATSYISKNYITLGDKLLELDKFDIHYKNLFMAFIICKKKYGLCVNYGHYESYNDVFLWHDNRTIMNDYIQTIIQLNKLKI